MSSLYQKKLIYVGFAFRHHKETEAGYHHIKDFLKYDKIIDCQWEHEFLDYPLDSFFAKVVRKFYRLLFRTGYTFTIIRCILLAVFHKNQVFHFVYAENTYKWLHLFIGKTNSIICTFHQPAAFFEESQKWKSELKYLDKVILMTKKDVDQFNQWIGKEKAIFIPHGINTNFYKPDLIVKKNDNILMVGNWLRDFEFANTIFESLLKKNQNLSITIVSNAINYHFFQNNIRLTFLTGISDKELRDLYRTSKLLFLPLKSFTANNAILEAAATGCQIVVATNEIDTSYLSEENIVFLPLNEEVVGSYILEFIENSDNTLKLIETRSFVIDNYSWEIVAKKTYEVLIS